MYLDLAKELKKNTDVMEMTFKKFNLQLIQFSYHPYSDNDADCDFLVELMSEDGDAIVDSVYLKINLYDENGDLFLNEYEFINHEDFSGYDTFKINLYDNGRTLLEAKSARIYMSKA